MFEFSLSVFELPLAETEFLLSELPPSPSCPSAADTMPGIIPWINSIINII
jgi:hypothetical protein